MKINIKNIKVRSICATLFISLFLACNNGIEELEKQRDSILSISNLRQGFLDVFTSFSDMVTDTLGINVDTKKEDIGKYFTNIETTMKKVKEKLNTLVAENGNYEKVKAVVDKFVADTLDKIAEGAKEAAKGAVGSDAIGSATAGQDAVPGEVASVNSLVKGIKTIVEVVLKKSEGDAGANKTKTSEQQTIGKLFAQGSGGSDGTEAEAAAANASIGAVTGADILQAILKSGDVSTNKQLNTVTSAAEIAVAQNSGTKTLSAVTKDAIIAAGIALRAMAKNGKFTAKNTEEKSAHAVNGAAVSAVNKTLSTLVIAIKNTVDSGLKAISEALAAVKQGDMSSETSESGATR
ncbi:variable large family protein (plasmid) [Borrelia coriaceae]|uniref:variable large family protein n=1 Tax=Borrelia coriaceae TaxID=144 RepID=UPI0004877DE1|nr:variable large family protein [Borrelia coriaceae]UPA17120.1 variable large family protein [Borrelia coriaceae]